MIDRFLQRIEKARNHGGIAGRSERSRDVTTRNCPRKFEKSLPAARTNDLVSVLKHDPNERLDCGEIPRLLKRLLEKADELKPVGTGLT